MSGGINHQPTTTPTATDWARLAAYIDGEGCIRIAPCKSKKWKREHLYIQVVVTNTDPRLPLWCAQNFGGRVYGHSNNLYKRQHPHWSSCVYWSINCQLAKRVLEGCLPYFIIKREQAEIAIAFGNTLKRWGVKGTPRDVIEKQYELKSTLSKMKGTASRMHRYKDKEVTTTIQ